MRKQHKKARHKIGKPGQSMKPRIIDMKPEDLAPYVRQAEPKALPIIKELEVSAGAAILLLAQYAQVLITGNSQITLESATAITDSVLALWQTGSYHPSPEYPFTLEETLQDLKDGLSAKTDYAEYFQPFTPSYANTPVGIGQVAGGIVQHPKTHLWQIWMMMNGPCTFLGAYRDPTEAQGCVERIVHVARYGDATVAKYRDPDIAAQRLYHELMSRGDGKPEQLPYDMMAYLLENIHLYTIDL